MAKGDKNITKENMNEWLHSLGFLFPRNELELERFDRLHSDFEHELKGDEVNPFEIIEGFKRSKIVSLNDKEAETLKDEIGWRMVARGANKLPKNVLDKMKKNQKKGK